MLALRRRVQRVGPQAFQLEPDLSRLGGIEGAAQIAEADEEAQDHKEQQLQHFGKHLLQHLRLPEKLPGRAQGRAEGDLIFLDQRNGSRQQLHDRHGDQAQHDHNDQGGLVGLALEELVTVHGGHGHQGKEQSEDPLQEYHGQQIHADAHQRAQQRPEEAGQIAAVVLVLLHLLLARVFLLPEDGGADGLEAEAVVPQQQAEAVGLGSAGNAAAIGGAHAVLLQGRGQHVQIGRKFGNFVLRAAGEAEGGGDRIGLHVGHGAPLDARRLDRPVEGLLQALVQLPVPDGQIHIVGWIIMRFIILMTSTAAAKSVLKSLE